MGLPVSDHVFEIYSDLYVLRNSECKRNHASPAWHSRQVALASAVKRLWNTGLPVHRLDGYAMLVSPNKGETAVHSCHCPGNMTKMLASHNSRKKKDDKLGNQIAKEERPKSKFCLVRMREKQKKSCLITSDWSGSKVNSF